MVYNKFLLWSFKYSQQHTYVAGMYEYGYTEPHIYIHLQNWPFSVIRPTFYITITIHSFIFLRCILRFLCAVLN